jgi:16S rRNA G1207 methylase RsmC
MKYLTQIKTPPPQTDLSLLKVVKSALKTSTIPISPLSQDSFHITTSELYVSTKSQNYNSIINNPTVNLQHN